MNQAAAESSPAFSTRPEISIRVYFPCPDCPTYFSNLNGFTGHMITDHWWDPPVAENYWNSAGA